MQYQEKRSIAFLLSNVAVTTLYCLFLMLNWREKFTLQSDDIRFWAIAILGIVPAHIVVRILIMIAFAVMHEVRRIGDPVDVEDELDKLIDLKSSRFSEWVFMLGFLAGLVCLAFGLPARTFVVSLGVSLVLSGLAGDLATLVLYRRGV